MAKSIKSTKTSKKAVTGRAQVETVEAGEKALTAYFEAMPKGDNGKPGGYASEREFLYTYVVPYALRRLAALDRYNAKK